MKKILALFALFGLQYWQGLMGFLPVSMFYNPWQGTSMRGSIQASSIAKIRIKVDPADAGRMEMI